MKNIINLVIILSFFHVSAFSQTKIQRNGKIKYKLKYNDKMLSKIIEVKKRNWKKNRKREVHHYAIEWKKGKVKLFWPGNKVSYTAYTSYEFKFDTTGRIYEIRGESEWSNHRVDEYIARRYAHSEIKSISDLEPIKNFYFYRLNYPYEVIINNSSKGSNYESYLISDIYDNRNRFGNSQIEYEFYFEEGQKEFKEFIK